MQGVPRFELGTNFQLVDKNVEITPDIHLIALVSDKPGTLELRELSLAINTPDGMVILVGCSHPGIDKIVEAAGAINPQIHLIVGGFHLVVSSDSSKGNNFSRSGEHYSKVYCEKVLQEFMLPPFNPRLNQSMRCCELPCVKDSG